MGLCCVVLGLCFVFVLSTLVTTLVSEELEMEHPRRVIDKLNKEAQHKVEKIQRSMEQPRDFSARLGSGG